MATTLRDVAREAGVAVNTASRVLRGDPHPMVSAKTRERVVEAARRLKYRHNLHARQLARGRSEAVGILAWQLAEGVSLARLQAVEKAIRARGYHSLVGFAAGHEPSQLQSAKEFASNAAEGAIVVNAGSAYRDALETLTERRIPIVSLELLTGLPVDVVTVDRAAGTYLAAKHLLELGHRRIAWLHGTNYWIPAFVEREEGFRKALAEHGCLADDSLRVRLVRDALTGDSYRCGWLTAREVLTRRPLPTAVLCNNDEIAIGAMRAFVEGGLRIPEDMAVVGFDDIRVAAYAPVPLTTVAQPVQEQVAQAVAILFDRIGNPDQERPPQTIRIDPRLVVRASCGAAAAGQERRSED